MAIESETFQDESDDAMQLRNALLIAGAVALAAYVAYRVFSPGEDEPDDSPDQPTTESDTSSPVWTAMKGAAVAYLVGIARERVSDVIAQFTQRTNAPSRTR